MENSERSTNPPDIQEWINVILDYNQRLQEWDLLLQQREALVGVGAPSDEDYEEEESDPPEEGIFIPYEALYLQDTMVARIEILAKITEMKPNLDPIVKQVMAEIIGICDDFKNIPNQFTNCNCCCNDDSDSEVSKMKEVQWLDELYKKDGK
jgi:hypothetical protein